DSERRAGHFIRAAERVRHPAAERGFPRAETARKQNKASGGECARELFAECGRLVLRMRFKYGQRASPPLKAEFISTIIIQQKPRGCKPRGRILAGIGGKIIRSVNSRTP